MRVMTLLFPENFPREEALAISALLQSPDADLASQAATAVLNKCVLIGQHCDHAKSLARACLDAGQVVAICEEPEGCHSRP